MTHLSAQPTMAAHDATVVAPTAPLRVRIAAAWCLGFVALTFAGWAGSVVASRLTISNAWRQGLQAVLMTGFVLPGVWYLRRRLDRRPVSGLAVLGVGRSLRGFALGAGLILTPYVATIAAVAFFGLATLSRNAAPGAASAIVIGLLTALFFEALPEELLFRGYIFRNLNGAMATWSASALSAALFAVLPVGVALFQRYALGMEVRIGSSDHVTVQYVATVFLFGCILQYLRVLTGTVWTGIGFHLLFLFANRLVGVRQSSYVLLSDVTSEGPLQLLFLGSITLMTAALLLYPRLAKRPLGWRTHAPE